MNIKEDPKKIAICLINHKSLYQHQIYPRAIGSLNYDIFEDCWKNKISEKESTFFENLEKWGIYHSPSEDLIVLKPDNQVLKRELISAFNNFKKRCKDRNKFLRYLQEVEIEEDKELFRKALIFLCRSRARYDSEGVRIDSSACSFLKVDEGKLRNILSRFVAKYGLATFEGEFYEGVYKLPSLVDFYYLYDFLCPYEGEELARFIEKLPEKELKVFNFIFEDQLKWKKLLDEVSPIREEIWRLREEKEDKAKIKELEEKANKIDKEIKEVEEKSKEKLKTRAQKTFITDAGEMAEILSIPKGECLDIVLNLKLKGLFATPNYSSEGLYWCEVSPRVMQKFNI